MTLQGIMYYAKLEGRLDGLSHSPHSPDYNHMQEPKPKTAQLSPLKPQNCETE